MLRSRPRELYTLGALVIIVATMVIYFGVIFPRDADAIYPWSSDAWGHLVKADYLGEQIGDGVFYPDLFPAWYSGQQLLRYFPPLSYYMLVGLHEVTGNIFTAGNLYVFLTSLIGGLSFLLFARRIGIAWAVVGGILYITFPDNIRVAFAEGNLPRLAAAALLPAAVYFLLNVLEDPGRKRNFAGLVTILGLIVLSHVMMAGIFVAGLGLYTLAYWLAKGSHFRVVVTGMLGLAVGLLVSGWWLFPSLTGGLAELDNTAGSEATASTTPSVALNPGLRSSDIEVFYLSLAAVVLLFVAIFMWRRLEPWSRALIVVTIITTLIGSTFIVDFWRAIPFSELFWARRFTTFAGFGLVMLAVLVARHLYASGAAPNRRWLRLAGVAVIAIMFIDFQPSFDLAHTRERPASVQSAADELADLEGWRVATIDLSKLGSAPSMLFTTDGEREQVFGWAFQGSITGPLLGRLNQSLSDGYLGFATSRLNRLGTDDVVLLPQPEISPNFGSALEADGYKLVPGPRDLLLYHRDGGPRALTIPMRVLGIGDGSENAAIVFPQMTVGSSSNIDDYSDDFLREFDLILLSRFTTSDRGDAESRVERLAAEGMRFVVDMTGAPVSPLTQQPKFLGVYGEPVLQIEQATLITEDGRKVLEPFDKRLGPWRSVTPQGAEEDLILFDYPAAKGVAVSRTRYGDSGGEVVFLGLNLMFHAARTGDAETFEQLEQLLGLPAREAPEDVAHSLIDYTAGEDGWTFDIDLPESGWVLFPMAHYEGTRVYVDGREVESVGIERLILAKMPEGYSSVEIRSVRTNIYALGNIATFLGLLIAIGFIAGVNRERLNDWMDGSRRMRRALERRMRRPEQRAAQS